ncbi:MAG: ferritin family protein [Planctomycetota bacterium]
MNIFDHAMKMETDGREYYLEHAKKQTSPALKKILLELADDELKHYNIFKALRDGASAEYKESEKTRIIRTVKNVFDDLKAKKQDLSFPDDAKSVWEHAREVEKKAEEFYREKAAEITDDGQKKILNRIADEEHRHWVTMQNVIQFLERPNHWLEDAEWSSLEE